MPLSRRREQTAPDLLTVQTVEGTGKEIDDIAIALRRAGCVVEAVVELQSGRWEITARSAD
jgi:hypothetical protein